jgi:hypothetical protein
MSDIKLDNPVGERFVFEWQYELLGSFSTHLARAIAQSDTVNRAKLSLAYPEEVKAVTDYQQTPNWWEAVEKKWGKGVV